MIICPNCRSEEISGALYCSECGSQIVYSEAQSTQSIFHDRSEPSPQPKQTPGIQASSFTEPPQTGSFISLHLVETGEILPLMGRNEYTIGRVAEGQPILPDVDLSNYAAYAQGVSRLHASLKVDRLRVTIMDLGSSNGTRVNGQKISSNFDYPVNHGDIIALGKLKIQVLFNR